MMFSLNNYCDCTLSFYIYICVCVCVCVCVPRMLTGPRWSTKVITEMTLKKEMKVIYDSSKSFRGEKSPRKHLFKVV